jgi:hypothetical protein
MNHSSTVHSISSQVNESNYLAYTGIPFILGETNSLYNEGAPGLSNSFGAALWGIDFNLWCASVGIQRTHMHMGTNYRYASWQPIQTNKTAIGTKPPYYGNIVVAAMMGNLVLNSVQIANIPLDDEREAAYAAYEDGKLARIAIVNMRQYNYTMNGTSSVLNPVARPEHEYTFNVPDYCSNSVSVQRLYANGSDAISGITWDGTSYNWELDEGKPVKLHNVTTGEKVTSVGGAVKVQVQDSTAVILKFRQRT